MDWLKELRIEKQLTHDDVAEQAGMTRAYYSMIENGVRTPSPSYAIRLGEILGFNWTRFYTDPEKPALETAEV